MHRLLPQIVVLIVILVAAGFARAVPQCNLAQDTRVPGGGPACGFGCRFGGAVSMSADGNTAIIGASGDNSTHGSAAVYVRSGASWVLQQSLIPTGGVGAIRYFGCAVSINADATTVIVGSYADNSSTGAVYVFTRSGTVWSQQGGKLLPFNTFGANIYFGNAVSLSADGNTAVIGAEGDGNYFGSAFVFVRTAGVWAAQGGRLFTSIGVGGNQRFGSSVAVSGDGNTAIIGAKGDNTFMGAAYIFTRTAGVWTMQSARILPVGGVGSPQHFGTSVAISSNGNTALIGANYDGGQIGAAYVLTRSGVVWTQQQKLTPTGGVGNGHFGASVALSPEGNTALVGADWDNSFLGAAYIFTRAGTVWSQQGAKLAPTGAVGSGQFGFAVALNPNAAASIIGAYSENSAVGAAYIFDRSCPADFNCAGGLNVQDIFSFLTAWFALDPRADFNGAGGITVADIFAFLTAWFAGCA